MVYICVIVKFLLFLQVQCVIAGEGVISNSASTNHKLGIEAAVAGNYDMSLAYLRAACRSDPKVPIYLNDLGVTEMRMGQYSRAKKRFSKALKIDKNLELAKTNLEELKRFMSKEEFAAGSKASYPQKHKLKPIRNLSAAEFMSIDFVSKEDVHYAFEYLSEPLVIRNALSRWNWNFTAFNLDEIVSLYGGSRCDYYPHNMVEEKVRPFFATLAETIPQLLSTPKGIYPGVDASEPGTYIQWNMPPHIWNELFKLANAQLPPLLDDTFWRKECFESMQKDVSFHINTHWKMLLIGEKGSGMFNHKDTLRTSSWQIQIEGRKKWHICSPQQDPYMYQAGDIDTFNPDYDRYPLFRETTCHQVTLHPGDVIFYPKDYWHQTLNLDTPTVAITGTIVTPDCYQHVTEELKKECSGSARIFIADPDLCRQLERCFEFWDWTFTEDPGQVDRGSSEGRGGSSNSRNEVDDVDDVEEGDEDQHEVEEDEDGGKDEGHDEEGRRDGEWDDDDDEEGEDEQESEDDDDNDDRNEAREDDSEDDEADDMEDDEADDREDDEAYDREDDEADDREDDGVDDDDSRNEVDDGDDDEDHDDEEGQDDQDDQDDQDEEYNEKHQDDEEQDVEHEEEEGEEGHSIEYDTHINDGEDEEQLHEHEDGGKSDGNNDEYGEDAVEDTVNSGGRPPLHTEL